MSKRKKKEVVKNSKVKRNVKRFNLFAYLQKYPEKDFYKKALLEATFKGHANTFADWKKAVEELFNKKL